MFPSALGTRGISVLRIGNEPAEILAKAASVEAPCGESAGLFLEDLEGPQ
jgi:hypothetical protein